MTISAEKPEIRRGFPIYLSGASNPKGSGAQYCSPPNTVIGIETRGTPHTPSSLLTNCSPPNTVIGIEFRYDSKQMFIYNFTVFLTHDKNPRLL